MPDGIENLRFAAHAALFMCVFSGGLLGTEHGQTTFQAIKSLDGLGGNPTALIVGKDDNLYGTLSEGGNKGEGVVFKLSKDGGGYTVLHNFTGYRYGEDGSWPQGVIEGSDGALYGTTQTGGPRGDALNPTGSGTVFKVNKDGSGYTVLHRFPGMSGNGIEPWAGLVEGRDGDLYGTTLSGGTRNAGTVFKLKKDGSAFTVLHSFSLTDGADVEPSVLVEAKDGAVYGATRRKGTVPGGPIVFKLSLSEARPASPPASQ